MAPVAADEGCGASNTVVTPAAAAAEAVSRVPAAGAGGEDHLAVPNTGVAVWWLRRFAEENADVLAGKSTGAVCFELVKLATRQPKCAFVDLPQMRALCDSSGRSAVGPAAVFASHAWSNSFLDFVAAVEVSLGVGSGTFVWNGALSCLCASLDCCLLNSHLTFLVVVP